MFIVDCKKAKPTLKQSEPLITSGSLNAFSVQFLFNDDWNGMTKFATFRKRGNNKVYEILLQDDNIADIPWELLAEPGPKIQVGAYGVLIAEKKQIRLPTIWINVEDISEGVLFGIEGREPTPDIFDQLVEALQNVPRPMTVEELRAILEKEESE